MATELELRIAYARKLLDEDYPAPEGYYWDEFGNLQPIDEPDEYKYVIGMDPGGTTGIAMLRYTDDTEAELVYLHQIPDGHVGFYDFFAGSMLDENLDVASEVWEERNVKGADREPIYVQGVQYALWQEPNNFHYQSPKMKSLVPDEWLKEQNLWTPGKRHQMDALIHALVFLRNNDHQPTMKALSDEGDPDQTMAEPGEAESKQLGEGDGMEALKEAMKALGEAAEATTEALEQLAEFAPGDDEGGHSYTGDIPEGDYEGPVDVEVKGTRKRREKNGVFAGFDTDNEGTETELYSD